MASTSLTNKAGLHPGGGRPLFGDGDLETQSMTMRREGQIAIVTGPGRGIGRAIANGPAREGAAVVLNYPDPSVSAEDAAHSEFARGDDPLDVFERHKRL